MDLLKYIVTHFPPLPRDTNNCAPAAIERLLHFVGERTLPHVTPCQFWDSLRFVAVTLPFLTVVWFLAHFILNLLSPTFSRIKPAHKQWYVVANISKSFCLFLMVISPFFLKGNFNCFILGNWEYETDDSDAPVEFLVKRYVSFYLLTDVAALYMVPKLPRTTVVHHVLSTLLSICIISYDFKYAQVPRMTALYGMFSTFSYAVNFFLAMRVMYNSRIIDQLALFALCVYVISCAANWTLHIFWFFGQFWSDYGTPTFASAVYFFSIMGFVRDDLILMKWLLARGSLPGSGIDFFLKKRSVKIAPGGKPASSFAIVSPGGSPSIYGIYRASGAEIHRRKLARKDEDNKAQH